MGFRFRRSFGAIPGVRINLGKRGASVSLGVRGAHMTVGPTGVRDTVGVPGTGASYTTTRSWGSHGTRQRLPVTPLTDEQPDANAGTSASGSGPLGWCVAVALFIILVAVLLSH
jgi:hypothetical protein